jgi:hypothetical protein
VTHFLTFHAGSIDGARAVWNLLPEEPWVKADVRGYPARTMYNAAMVEADRAVRLRKVLVAEGPTTPVRHGAGPAGGGTPRADQHIVV